VCWQIVRKLGSPICFARVLSGHVHASIGFGSLLWTEPITAPMSFGLHQQVVGKELGNAAGFWDQWA
jgi:hypothetical protein